MSGEPYSLLMRILITGTGTGVGKTWVGQALALALRSAGKRVLAVKPVETGCIGPPNDREDGVLLARATGQSQPAHAIFRLPDQIPPTLSSDRSGITIDFDGLVLKIERYCYDPDVDETGTTFEANAILKAEAGLKATGMWTLADDSGIEAPFKSKR